jgi:glycosyltransferase involved in cell wall biosynthesis
MPRIAHVISTPERLGGAERVLEALVGGAADRAWEQRVLNPFARDPEASALRAFCPEGTYRGAPCTRFREVPALRSWLKAELTGFGPDLVHAHLFHAGAVVASFRRPGGARRVLTHHHGNKLVMDGGWPLATIDRIAGLRYDKVVAVSEWGRRFLVSRYRYPSRSLECIPNGWRGNPRSVPAAAPEPTVVSVANFRAQKGHEVLLAAFDGVLEQVPGARLVLVGEGERQDIWPCLARAHVFALASHYEPLGIAILEAMAAGLPVVATEVGGIPEIVQPGVTGELVADGDAAAMTDRLIALLGSAALRERMGAAAKEAAAGMTMDVTVDRYFALYERLLGGSGG